MARVVLNKFQKELRNELCDVHGLDPSQISFNDDEIAPIFDYEALNALSIRLTDIRRIATTVARAEDHATAVCEVELHDGRSRAIEETAYLGEAIGNGETIDSLRLCEQVAQARAARRGIRSVGVNLYHAHRKFMETGEIAISHTNHDPRNTQYQEINVLAAKAGLKTRFRVRGEFREERSGYEDLIASNFNGKTSATELDDIELGKLKTMLRALVRVAQSGTAAKKAA